MNAGGRVLLRPFCLLCIFFQPFATFLLLLIIIIINIITTIGISTPRYTARNLIS